MNRKNKIIVSVVGIVIVLLALLGLTYGYYLTRIQGNTNTNSISVTTADLRLVYRDGNNIITASEIEPGWTNNGQNGNPEPKTFTITNEGNTAASFSISLVNVVNTLTNYKDLTYVVTKNGSKIKEGVFPSMDKTIVLSQTLDAHTNGSCTIENNCMSEYAIEITYANANYDQSEDMNKTFSCLVQITNEIETIKIEDANDMKALSRALTNSKIKTSSYNINDDIETLGLDLSNLNEEEKISYLQNANYELINDIDLTYNRNFGDDFFYGIGNKDVIFYGNFYGNDHNITLNSTKDIELDSYINSFGIINTIENGLITDLKINLSSDINAIKNRHESYYGVLTGRSKNTKYENIDISLNEYNYTFNQSPDVDHIYRQKVSMGLLIGRESNGGKIQNITIDIKNANLELTTIQDSDYPNFFALGGLIGQISNVYDSRTTINNIKINMDSSNINCVANKNGNIGGLVGSLAFADISNAKVITKNSTIGCTSEKTEGSYNGLSAGGIVGFVSNGADNNDSSTFGRFGGVLNNIEFISKNESLKEIIYAKETTGAGVNAGGIVGLAYNNASINNAKVDITNGTIISERISENETKATYGAHTGGIIGRMEHTSNISNSVVNGNNLNITTNSTEQHNYAGGIAGVILNPIHRDINPLENNIVNGNGTTNINLNLINGKNQNRYIMAGGLTGNAYYVIKNNSVNGVNVNISGVNENTSDAYVSNYIGKYQNLPSTTQFTPRENEIINSIINNVYVNTNGLDNYLTINNY